MMCRFCGNRQKCWGSKSDEEIEQECVKCDYDDYVLDDGIELDDLIAESDRRIEVNKYCE